jgi:hypothetical protein
MLVLIFKKIPSDAFCKTGIAEECPGYPPPPWVYRNQRVSGKLRNNLWGSTTYGQNLDIKELRINTLKFQFHNGTNAMRPHSHVLRDDGAFALWMARADVTRPLWKTPGP